MNYRLFTPASRLFAVLLAAGLIGCGSSQQTSPSAGPGTPDGPGQGPATGLQQCSQEVALTCAAGFIDGCLVENPQSPSGMLTTRHVCVAEDERNDIPCVQEIARQCPPGQIDACMVTPAAAEFHVCVVAPEQVGGDGNGGGGNSDEAFCGSSTQAACQQDADCRRGGCSGQICESASAEPTVSTCEYRDCYNPDTYNLTCGCVNNQCAWN